MASVSISPKPLPGKWTAAYSLDLHTTSSDFLGYDEYGHEVFDTKRTEMGELLYRLKFKSDKSVTRVIVETVVKFIRDKGWAINLVIPVPPSKASRSFQPVILLAQTIANELKVEYCIACVVKVKDTPQLKNVFDPDKRRELLQNAFAVASQKLAGQNILLFDDLYRSGATLESVGKTLTEKGKVKTIYALTLTRTRSNR
ncbi:MAG: ComF family protein [Chloroflexi bacterium]|nr:ComF family protein [Chloroflexota bacterium]